MEESLRDFLDGGIKLSKRFEYFACDGGPHVVMSSIFQRLWRGMGKDSNPLQKGTHFERACAISGIVGILEIGEASALVLAGSPPISGWGYWGSSNEIPDLYIFESWKELDSMSQLASVASNRAKPTPTGLRWQTSGKTSILMFAGDTSQKPVYGKLEIPIPEGTFELLTDSLQIDSAKIIVIRLAPVKS